MDYKQLHSLKKRVAAFFLTLTIVASVFYAPVFTPRTKAFLGIGDFGVTIDIKAFAREIADGIAMALAQRMIDDMVKSTITWANTGFNGGPAYVTDAKQYFANSADRAAGEFIAGSELGFLCSPFQANIRLSLVNQYYEPVQNQYQCSITGIKGNITNFFSDFNNGGWDAWFSITQNPTNNPYGAYLKASVDLDSRIANALALSKSEYDTGDGFLSLKECDAYNPNEATLQAFEDWQAEGFPVSWTEGNPMEKTLQDMYYGKVPYNLSLPGGACVKDGKIKTAGTTIKTQLDNVLPSGLEKLITLNHVEQLVGAFANGLLQRYVFGSKGLFGKDYGDHLSVSNDSPVQKPQELECYTSSANATTNQTKVTWTVLSSLGFGAEYLWSGEGLENATGTSVSLVYTTSGVKTASVTATSRDTDGRVTTLTANCPNISVSSNSSLLVSCSPKVPGSAEYDTPVSWEARITGGSGKFRSIQWDGEQAHIPKTNGDNTRMWPRDIVDPNVPFVSWLYGTPAAGNHGTATTDTKYSTASFGVTTQTLTKNGNTFVSTVTRVYLRDKDPINSVNASVTVWDTDPTLPAVTADCSPDLQIRN